MKQNIAVVSALLSACLFAAQPLRAQFGSWKSLKDSVKNSSLGSRLTAPSQRATDMASYLTIATDQGMKALDELAAAFPANKVAAFKKLSEQYNEAKTTRVNGNIDAESFTTASRAAAEMAKLETDWKSYKKEGAKGVRKADARLGLMLIADAEASTKAPQTAKDLDRQITVAASHPKDTSKLGEMRSSLSFLNCVTQQTPSQIQSFSTVRRIAKNIAEAEHYQLPPDPAPDSVASTAEMTVAAQKIDADIPS